MADSPARQREPQWPSAVPPWPADFPDVVTQSTLDALYGAALRPGDELADGVKSPTYLAAKAGDTDAAIHVVRAVIRPDLTADIGRRFPGAVVVSVHAEEEAGRNKLPTVYATALGDIGGLAVDDSIVQVNRVHHTGATARQRLARRPAFVGPVRPGCDYVLCDDVVTSGSSLAALRHFVEARGGRVVLATTLAAAPAKHGMTPTRLVIRPETVAAVLTKFDPARLADILYQYGIAPTVHHLTESEGLALLGFDSIDAVRSSLTAARQAGHRP